MKFGRCSESMGNKPKVPCVGEGPATNTLMQWCYAFTVDKIYVAPHKTQQKHMPLWPPSWADVPQCQQPTRYVISVPLLSFAVPLFWLIFRCKKVQL